MQWRAILILAIVVALSGCEGDAAPGEPICDGTTDLRFRAYTAGGGQEAYGSQVRTELGFRSLAVDGQCRYWVNSGWSPNLPLTHDREWRQGLVTRAEAASIEATLSLRHIEALGNCPPSGVSDGGSRALASAAGTVFCDSRNARFDRAYAAVEAIALNLWERGSALDGGLRVVAVAYGPPPIDGIAPPYDWPLGKALGAFLDRLSLVDDAGDARALRALRDRYISERGTELYGRFITWQGMLVREGDSRATIYMRDSLPHENAEGKLPF